MTAVQTALDEGDLAVASAEGGSTPVGSVTSPRRRKGPGRTVTLLTEIALTLGAVFGVAVAGITVIAARSGMQPLVVRSGSMEPTIETGSMILVKRIDASEIRVGDVVAVERPDHTRVTHRVVAVRQRADAAELTMKGDANEDPDPIPVTVRHAYRLAWQVPMVGKALAWLATAQGGFLLGCVTTAFAFGVTGRRARCRA